MKVLIIHNSGLSSLPSGELIIAKNELQSLRQEGIECNLHVVYNDKIKGYNHLKKLYAEFNVFWSYSSCKLVESLLEKYNPDIVHFHGVLQLLTMSAFHACKRKNIPVIQTLHNYRRICVEGGLFKDNWYCEKCVSGSGWQGAYYGCSRNSRLISAILYLNNLFYRKTKLIFSFVDKFITVSEFVKAKMFRQGFLRKK